jgi:hypothetical protein
MSEYCIDLSQVAEDKWEFTPKVYVNIGYSRWGTITNPDGTPAICDTMERAQDIINAHKAWRAMRNKPVTRYTEDGVLVTEDSSDILKEGWKR